MKIVVVGSNGKFCAELKALLETQSHGVEISAAAAAFDAVARQRAQLVVLAALSAKDAGKELIRSLRANVPTRQIAILSVDPARKAEDVVETLDTGADDFIAKPFNDQIFLARVRTLLRRQIWLGLAKEEPVTVHRAGALSVHLVERAARTGADEHKLTRLEFELLAFLIKNKGQVLERARLLEAVWQYPENVETRTLDKHVENLRKKIGASGAMISTIHGVGYRLQEPSSAPRKST